MIACFYCGKEVVANDNGDITVAWLPEIQSTNLDMPYCNEDCFTKQKLKHRIIKPVTKKEVDFFLEIVAQERREENNRHEQYIDKLKEELKQYSKQQEKCE